MPTYDSSTGEPVDVIALAFPEGVHVRSMRVEHSRVELFDGDGRQVILVERHHRYPGAGLEVDFGEHVNVERS